MMEGQGTDDGRRDLLLRIHDFLTRYADCHRIPLGFFDQSSPSRQFHELRFHFLGSEYHADSHCLRSFLDTITAPHWVPSDSTVVQTCPHGCTIASRDLIINGSCYGSILLGEIRLTEGAKDRCFSVASSGTSECESPDIQTTGDSEINRLSRSTVESVFDFLISVLPSVMAVNRENTRPDFSSELEQERFLLKQIMDLNPVGIVMLNAEGHITQANKEAERVLRLSTGEVLGKTYDAPEWHITDLKGNPLSSELLPFEIVRRTEKPIHDYRHAIHQGDARTILSINAVPVFTLQGDFNGMIGTVSDMTTSIEAEEALIRSAATLRSVLKAAPVGIGLVTDRVFNWTNPRLSEMTGYSADELIGKRATMLYENQTEFDRVGQVKYQSIRSTGTGSVETRWVRKDGRLIDIILSSTAIDAKDLTRGVVFTAQDITDRIQTEKVLKRSEEHYRFIFEGAGDAIFGVDAVTQKAMFANTRMCALTGYSLEELMSFRIPDIHPRQDVEWIMTEFQQQRSGEKETAIEIPVLRKDGTIVYCDINVGNLELDGRHVAVGFFRDASERIIAYRTVHEMAEKYKTIIESIPIGMHLYELSNDDELIFIDANPAADRILGVNNKNFVGKSINDAFPALAETEIPERYRSVIQTGVAWHLNEFLYSEDVISGIFEIHAFRTDPGRMAVAFSDVSDRKQMLDQLRSSLKEKEVLLRELHHRVKNNLQLIRSLINLQSQHITDYEMSLLFQETRDRVMSMALVHELLYQSDSFASININSYLQTITNHLIRSYVLDVSPQLSFRTDEINLSIDQAIPCGLILTELITNALKYAFLEPEHGVLEIEFLSNPPDGYRLCVRDNGIGLPEDITLQDTKTLGLTLIRLLVEQLGGTCLINRSPGTEFVIEFKERPA